MPGCSPVRALHPGPSQGLPRAAQSRPLQGVPAAPSPPRRCWCCWEAGPSPSSTPPAPCPPKLPLCRGRRGLREGRPWTADTLRVWGRHVFPRISPGRPGASQEWHLDASCVWTMRSSRPRWDPQPDLPQFGDEGPPRPGASGRWAAERHEGRCASRPETATSR